MEYEAALNQLREPFFSLKRSSMADSSLLFPVAFGPTNTLTRSSNRMSTGSVNGGTLP